MRFSQTDLLLPFRDLGTIRRPDELSSLSCDPVFNRYTSFWTLGPTLDAGAAAVEATARLTGRPAEAESDIVGLLARHHELGPAVRFRTNGHARTSGVYALHNAIALMRVCARRADNEPLGGDRFSEIVRKFADWRTDPCADVTEFMRACVQATPDRAAFMDRPGAELPATVTTTYTALSVLWNLHGDGASARFFELVERPAISVFLRSCLRTEERAPGVRIAAFTIHPDADELCVNTTFFALNLIHRLGLKEDVLGEGAKRRILRFLSLASPGGPFRSTLIEPPSLNATRFGLRALKLLDGSEYEGHRSGYGHAIRDFVVSCQAPDGGFAFGNDAFRFAPNALATRYGIQILNDLRCRVSDELRTSLLRFLEGLKVDHSFNAYDSAMIDVVPDGRSLIEQQLAFRDARFLDELGRDRRSELAGVTVDADDEAADDDAGWLPDDVELESPGWLSDRIARLEARGFARNNERTN